MNRRRVLTVERFRRWVQTLAIKWVDPLFADAHPGTMGASVISSAAPLLRHLQANDRWSLGAHLREWVRLLDVPPRLPLPVSKRIFVFSCYRGQFTHDLVLAVLLAWRGHTVTFGYLPKLRSPIKSPLQDHPQAPQYLERALGQLQCLTGGRVRAVDLSKHPVRSDAPGDPGALRSQIRADTILCLQREKLDMSDPLVEETWEYFAALGQRAQRLALSWFLDNAGAFDLVLLANGSSFEASQFCDAAKKFGIPVNTHEKFAFSNVKVVTHGDAFFHFSDLDRIWRKRHELGFESPPLRNFVIEKAWALLDQRRGSSGLNWGLQYQKGKPQRDFADISTRLGITAGEFVLVCPNVPFDSGYDGWLKLFPSMRQWLTRTVAFLIENSARKVVIRAHPAETRPGYGSEKIDRILAEAGVQSDRVVIVPGDSDINTYDLMPQCRFAAVFASTTGVEIAMHGRPVLAGASVYYARCGISLPAEKPEQYFAQLARLAGDTAPPQSDADAAAQLYFIFHYLLQWRYPYDKPSQIAAMPPRLLPEHPDSEDWIETIDSLTMSVPEFEAALPRFTAPARIMRVCGKT